MSKADGVIFTIAYLSLGGFVLFIVAVILGWRP